jgi:acetyl-CoA C-acetyltransferase
MGALSMEAVGISKPGQALGLAEDGLLSIRGPRPMWTFGGNKARGNALGASGMYQIVEAAMQLCEKAGDNQVPDARVALVQCLGSFGSTAVTHVLAR